MLITRETEVISRRLSAKVLVIEVSAHAAGGGMVKEASLREDDGIAK